MIKRLNQQEDIKITNVDASKKHSFRINEEKNWWSLTDKETNQQFYFNISTLLSGTARSREVITENIKDWSNSINQLDLADIYG